MRKTLAATVGIAAILGVIGVAQPAIAAPVHSDTKSLCSSGWSYVPIARGADSFSRVGSPQSDYNGTKTTERATFSAQTAGTVSATFTGSADLSLSVEIAQIAGHWSIATSVSKTTTIGNAISLDVPAGKTGNGEYGAWRAYVTGKEQFTNNACVITTSSAKNIYAPYKVGWHTWIS